MDELKEKILQARRAALALEELEDLHALAGELPALLEVQAKQEAAQVEAEQAARAAVIEAVKAALALAVVQMTAWRADVTAAIQAGGPDVYTHLGDLARRILDIQRPIFQARDDLRKIDAAGLWAELGGNDSSLAAGLDTLPFVYRQALKRHLRGRPIYTPMRGV